ncbi:hypothetical protein [Roseomonas sp. WA12]
MLAVSMYQNIPYVFEVIELEPTQLSIDFWDTEATDRLGHIKYLPETSELVLNSYINGRWQTESRVPYQPKKGSRIEIRCGTRSIWIKTERDAIQLDVPFNTPADHIGFLALKGFDKPSNILESDVLSYPALKPTISSIEFTVLQARIQFLERRLEQLFATSNG